MSGLFLPVLCPRLWVARGVLSATRIREVFGDVGEDLCSKDHCTLEINCIKVLLQMRRHPRQSSALPRANQAVLYFFNGIINKFVRIGQKRVLLRRVDLPR